MSIKADLLIVRQALGSAKAIACVHQYGGLHKLWSLLVEGTEALERIEKEITTTQIAMPLFPDTARYKRGT